MIGDMNWIPIEVGRNKHYTAHERIQNFLQQTALPPAGVLARRRWRWSRWWPGRRRVMCIRVPASASAGAPSELRIGSFKSHSNPEIVAVCIKTVHIEISIYPPHPTVQPQCHHPLPHPLLFWALWPQLMLSGLVPLLKILYGHNTIRRS